MSRAATGHRATGATPTLFHRLIDDAALFPPGNAPMDEAVPAHLSLRAGPLRELVGPFLCPASRIPELLTALPGDRSLEIGLIVDTGLDSVGEATTAARADARVRTVMVEVPVPPGSDLAAGAARAVEQVEQLEQLEQLGQTGPDIRLHVELPRSAGWRQALDVLADAGRGAKLRTGGLTQELFPSDAELAAFVLACRERAVPFKCTAGLHHAVRYTDPDTGFRHHGVLNILVATAKAVTGGASAGVAMDDVLSATARAASTSRWPTFESSACCHEIVRRWPVRPRRPSTAGCGSSSCSPPTTGARR
jgi:hypothetical protein